MSCLERSGLFQFLLRFAGGWVLKKLCRSHFLFFLPASSKTVRRGLKTENRLHGGRYYFLVFCFGRGMNERSCWNIHLHHCIIIVSAFYKLVLWYAAAARQGPYHFFSTVLGRVSRAAKTLALWMVYSSALVPYLFFPCMLAACTHITHFNYIQYTSYLCTHSHYWTHVDYARGRQYGSVKHGFGCSVWVYFFQGTS